MNGTLRLGLIFSCLILTFLTPQILFPSVPKAHAASAQPSMQQLPQEGVYSSSLWATANNFSSQTKILNYTAARALLSSPVTNPATFQDPPGLFTNNFRVTSDYNRFPTEDEPSIAATNQSGHVLMVVGANSLSTALMPAYYSKDQGTTWNGPTFLQLARPTDNFGSDPALAVSRTGTFYYSFLSIGETFNFPFFSEQDDIVVATSHDGGNWTNHIAVQRGNLNSSSNIVAELYDKEYMTVGPGKTNPAIDAVYVTYTDFVDYRASVYGPYFIEENATIMQVHSTDGGFTWSKPIAVSPTFIDSIYPHRVVTGSMPAVAPNGDVYVAYFDTGSAGFLNGNASIMITKSTDGGNTFSAPSKAAFIPQQLTYYSSNYFFSFRWWSTMFPSMDVAPDGTVYISYGARQSAFSADPSDIYLVASTDGGATWDQPVRVNDATSQNGAFFSWLKVSSDGVVHIIWGDRRFDPAGLRYDVFYAKATNHGTSISDNIRVTDISTDPSFIINFVGDYFNMAVSGNQVYPVWTDGRRGIRPNGKFFLYGETDIFMARIGPRDTPTLSFGKGPAAGYLPTPVTVTGSGLPRDAMYSMNMSGAPVNSLTYGLNIFFSDRSGHLSDLIFPISNYYGAYQVQLSEFASGFKVVSGTLYVIDTRGLQVLVSGPTSAHPGDTVTWNVVLSLPTGSTSPGGLSTSLALNQVLLTSPDGSSLDLSANVKSIVPTLYSISTTLSTSAQLGSYGLFVNASQTGPIVQSVGVGSTSLSVASPSGAKRSTTISVSCTPNFVQKGQATTCLATVTDTTPADGTTPAGSVKWTTTGTGTFTPTSCTLSGTGASASCWVGFMASATGTDIIDGSYAGTVSQPPASQLTIVTVTNAATGVQIGSMMLGALTGGIGIAGVAAGAIGTIVARRKKQ